ncbi:hypothetical protein L211DRAFT_844845 [Terfezia boudieri ATCC MYA-4762]|uniref:Uncharacterized protein n=1 Tax=Terfezia boudieri ATCC MYA-4762 TaxID=1051890 RepID=A0A3N4M0Q9_9PEZI|nr:hypothetical protein L211DRAFT_844845 [Terfezia boudieri ATCC MYA-4762]
MELSKQLNPSPQVLDLQTLSLPNGPDLIAQSLDLLEPIERGEALVTMAHRLIKIRQESGSTLGAAAGHVLEAIEVYKPWEPMGILRNDYSKLAVMGQLKELAQFHHDTVCHKMRAEEVLQDKWGSNWRRELEDLSPPSDSTHYLRELAKVATLVTLQDGIRLFKVLVDRRKNNLHKGVSTKAHLKPGDLRILRSMIVGKMTPNALNVCSALSDFSGDQNLDIQDQSPPAAATTAPSRVSKRAAANSHIH